MLVYRDSFYFVLFLCNLCVLSLGYSWYGADFCLPSLRIRSMPFLGASSELVTRLATLQCQI